MSKPIEDYSDEVWDKFFDFIAPDVGEMTDDEVEESLRRAGIDAGPAVERVLAAVRKQREHSSMEFLLESDGTVELRSDDGKLIAVIAKAQDGVGLRVISERRMQVSRFDALSESGLPNVVEVTVKPE